MKTFHDEEAGYTLYETLKKNNKRTALNMTYDRLINGKLATLKGL